MGYLGIAKPDAPLQPAGTRRRRLVLADIAATSLSGIAETREISVMRQPGPLRCWRAWSGEVGGFCSVVFFRRGRHRLSVVEIRDQW